MDPEERKQMYLDINGFLQNVRPNHRHHNIEDDYAFNHVKIEGIEGGKEGGVYNLFNDGELMELMEKMSQEDGVKFDSREGFYSKIERDWLPQDDNDGGVLGEIIEYVAVSYTHLTLPTKA